MSEMTTDMVMVKLKVNGNMNTAMVVSISMPWAMPALVGYGNGYSKSMTIYHPLPYFSITLINMKSLLN